MTLVGSLINRSLRFCLFFFSDSNMFVVQFVQVDYLITDGSDEQFVMRYDHEMQVAHALSNERP